MRAIACFALVLLSPLPALAQTTDQAALPPSAAESRLPLAAMRHEQPRRDDVVARERDKLEPNEAQALQRERAEEDRLYNEVMRNSAPAAAVH